VTVTGRKEIRIWEYAGHPHGGVESSTPREPLGYEPYRSAVVPTPLESPHRVCTAHRPGSTWSVSATVPTTGKSGKWRLLLAFLVVFLLCSCGSVKQTTRFATYAFSCGTRTHLGLRPPHKSLFLDHTQLHRNTHTRTSSSGLLLMNTTDEHPNFHWDYNPGSSNRAASDLRVRPHGHWYYSLYELSKRYVLHNTTVNIVFLMNIVLGVVQWMAARHLKKCLHFCPKLCCNGYFSSDLLVLPTLRRYLRSRKECLVWRPHLSVCPPNSLSLTLYVCVCVCVSIYPWCSVSY